jgi:hypothetical protein
MHRGGIFSPDGWEDPGKFLEIGYSKYWIFSIYPGIAVGGPAPKGVLEMFLILLAPPFTRGE